MRVSWVGVNEKAEASCLIIRTAVIGARSEACEGSVAVSAAPCDAARHSNACG